MKFSVDENYDNRSITRQRKEALNYRYLASFIVLKCHPYLESSLGLSWTVLVMAAFGCACLVVAAALLPETRGLTLTEMAKLFSREEKEKGEGRKGESLMQNNQC